MSKSVSVPAYYEAKNGSFLLLQELLNDPNLRSQLLAAEARKFDHAKRRMVAVRSAANDNQATA